MIDKRVWIAGLVLVLGVGAGVAAVREATPSEGASPTASSAPPADFAAQPTAIARPAANAPVWDRGIWVAQEVTAMLRAQSEALMAGDYGRFAAGAARGDRAAAADLRRRFDNLRAMKVTLFEQQADGPPRVVKGKRGRWQVQTIARTCFVDVDCATELTLFSTVWQETADGLHFAAFAPFDKALSCNKVCPTLVRPWETTDLAVQVGRRTLVAVPVRYRSRLAGIARRAEVAAARADRFVIGDGPVERYRVFVADDEAWRRWYRGSPGAWVAGQAVPTGPNGVEVAVHLDELTPSFTDELLRHELAHVASLRSSTYYDDDDVWWLVEGMAEYVGTQGPYADRPAMRAYLGGHALRSVRVDPPGRKASSRSAAGRYAVGYYAVEYLMKRYGKRRTLAFFQQAVQYGLGLDNAARTALGKPWPAVDKECAAAVRKA